MRIIPYQAPNPPRPGTMAVKQHKGRRSSTVVASESAALSSSATQSNCSTEAGTKCNRLQDKAPPNETSNPRDHRGHDYHRMLPSGGHIGDGPANLVKLFRVAMTMFSSDAQIVAMRLSVIFVQGRKNITWKRNMSDFLLA